MKLRDLIKSIADGDLDTAFAARCGTPEDKLAEERSRALHCADLFGDRYGGERDVMLLSVSGRSEISGNHTDHNYGRVLAGAIICAFCPAMPNSRYSIGSIG